MKDAKSHALGDPTTNLKLRIPGLDYESFPVLAVEYMFMH
jgi:hypothetical protein